VIDQIKGWYHQVNSKKKSKSLAPRSRRSHRSAQNVKAWSTHPQSTLNWWRRRPNNLEHQTQDQKSSIWSRLLQPLDKLKRRVAVVPSVNETVSAMKEIGVDLTNDEK
jgi:hypothetical protein